MKNKTKVDMKLYKWDKTKTDFVPGNNLFKDRTGERLGKLVLQYPVRDKHGNSCWVCKCDCGGESTVIMGNLGRVRACSCGISRKAKDNPGWNGTGDISGLYLYQIRYGAEKRNIDYNLTAQYLWNLYIKQQGKCALSKMDIEIIYVKKSQCDKTASLDRIDSSKGYVEGNVQWVHKDVNRMKNSFNQEYFISICKQIVVNSS